MSEKLEGNAANKLRLVAAEIIHKLWQAGETTQLEVLKMQAERSLEEPYTASTESE